jgi:Co/Zn/Cd efflux system component
MVLAILLSTLREAARTTREEGSTLRGVNTDGARCRYLLGPMDDCCNDKAREVAQLHGRVLRAVLAINAGMFGVEFLAGLLAGVPACFALLYRHRADGLNMRSTWLCSRNDVIGNVAVLAAAGGVAALGRSWPDLIVGAGIAVLFLRTAVGVIRESVQALSQERPTAQRAG